MTFKKFEELLHSKYPSAHACAHGTFGGTKKNKKVEINFQPNGKAYEYYGSYQDVLRKVGIDVLYKSDVEAAMEKLARYKEEHGKKDPWHLFGDFIYDWTREIEACESFIDDINNGKYIIIE